MVSSTKNEVVSEEVDPATLFALLDDRYARRILAHLNDEPMSAKTLSERCDASPPTIYRRIDRLKACGLLVEETKLDENGNHYAIYESRFDSLSVTMDDGEFAVNLSRRDDPADRMTHMWEEMR